MDEHFDEFRDEVWAVQIKEMLKSCCNATRNCPALYDYTVIVSQAETIARLKKEIEQLKVSENEKTNRVRRYFTKLIRLLIWF